MLKTNAPYETGKPEVEKFVVRLPGGMRGRIAAVARQSRRSMNSEIIARLEQSLAEVGVVQVPNDTEIHRPPALRAVDASSADEAEQRLLRAFRKLPPGKREAVLGFLE